MIILVIVDEFNKVLNRKELIVSHGIDMDSDTLDSVVFPPVHPREVGARFDYSLGEWVID